MPLIDDIGSHRAAHDRYDLAAQIAHEIARRFRAQNVAEALQAKADALGLKTCPICQQTKPILDFGRNVARGDGRQAICRACRCGCR